MAKRSAGCASALDLLLLFAKQSKTQMGLNRGVAIATANASRKSERKRLDTTRNTRVCSNNAIQKSVQHTLLSLAHSGLEFWLNNLAQFVGEQNLNRITMITQSL
jgi:hypothetical protein